MTEELNNSCVMRSYRDEGISKLEDFESRSPKKNEFAYKELLRVYKSYQIICRNDEDREKGPNTDHPSGVFIAIG